MSFNIIYLQPFRKELKRLAKKYPSLKSDFADLLSILERNPNHGISIGKNCFKIRLAITSKGRGKSGGARIITHFLINLTGETLYLLKIYDKSEEGTISDAELKELLDSIEVIFTKTGFKTSISKPVLVNITSPPTAPYFYSPAPIKQFCH